MSNMYGWFDWEDQTTSVNSLAVIKEPRKPFNEYVVGEEIVAKLPQFTGLWKGAIVEIHESRALLLGNLGKRQKTQTSTQCVDSEAKSGHGKRSLQACEEPSTKKHKLGEESKSQKKTAKTNTENENRNNKGDGSKSQKKQTQANKENENVNKTEKAQLKEKERDLDEKKLTARKLQMDEIINSRSTIHPAGSFEQQQSQDLFLTQVPPMGNGTPFVNPWSGYTLPDQSHTYSYMGDLTRMYSYSELESQKQEIEVQNEQLQKDMYALRKENAELRQQLDNSKCLNEFSDIPVTPRKVAFLKKLVAVFEMSSPARQLQSPNQLISVQTPVQQSPILQTPVQQSPILLTPVQQSPILLTPVQQSPILQTPVQQSPILQTPVQQSPILLTPVQQSPILLTPVQQSPILLTPVQQSPILLTPVQQSPILQTPVQQSPILQTPVQQSPNPVIFNQPTAGEMSLTLESDETSDLQDTSIKQWEETATPNGVKKVQLVTGHNVYITQAKLSTALVLGNAPRKLALALLECFFSKETLAKSCAMGKRTAHNSSNETMALPSTVLQAINEFVLRKFKQESGEPALSQTAFNGLVNSKCATARRSLKM